MFIETFNPANGKRLESYPLMSQGEVRLVIQKNTKAFQEWRRLSMADRASRLNAAARILRDFKSDFGNRMTHEMGKPISQAEGEAEKCAWVCEHYAEHAARYLQPESIPTEATESFASFQPLGSLLAIMPWNFPFWQVFRCAAPALMAGNSLLLKHASNVTGCALAIERIFEEAGFPENLFRTLLVSSKQIPSIISHPNVKAVTLTGSETAGRSVASHAGQQLKKSVLELGGSDPYLILQGAHLESAVETCVASRLINSGQSCIAAKRFIVVESLAREFAERMTAKMAERTLGEPSDPKTQIGPQAREDLQQEVHRQVRRSVDMGAKLLSGGEIPRRAGFFYPPTVLSQVQPGMPAYEEEVFGPAAAIISVRDDTEAVRVANDSPFGLGATVFTQDVAKGRRIAEEELEAGCCFVNDFVKSDPRLPFGGVKQSGYGRELGAFGIREFVNIKSIVVK